MDQPPITLTKPSRILIACSRCKARKYKCDGGKPRCGNCAARGDAECDYAAARRMRGPGKNKTSTTATSNPQNGLPEQPTEPTPAPNNSPPTAPNFPLSGVFEHRKNFEGHIDEVIAGRRQYTPLLPRTLASRLIHNSFDAITADHPLLDLPTFAALLDEQYAASPSDPAGDSARWALVNAVLALALRFKTAPGAERELAAYPRAYYRNAAAVLPELVLLDPPSVRSAQALLATTLCARDVSGSRAALVMLTAGASRQVEMLQQRLRHAGPLMVLRDAAEEAQLGRAYGVACALEALVAQRYGFRPVLDGTGG